NGNVAIKVEANSPRWQDSQILETKIKVQPENPKADKARVFADRLRFGIAFGIALAGLKSGALDQLAKLGFVQATVAILALGFGADTLKNLLTQSSRPQSSPAPPSPSAQAPDQGSIDETLNCMTENTTPPLLQKLVPGAAPARERHPATYR